MQYTHASTTLIAMEYIWLAGRLCMPGQAGQGTTSVPSASMPASYYTEVQGQRGPAWAAQPTTYGAWCCTAKLRGSHVQKPKLISRQNSSASQSCMDASSNQESGGNAAAAITASTNPKGMWDSGVACRGGSGWQGEQSGAQAAANSACTAPVSRGGHKQASLASSRACSSTAAAASLEARERRLERRLTGAPRRCASSSVRAAALKAGGQ